MIRIAYELIAVEANRLVCRMVRSHLCNDFIDAWEARETYLALLTSCSWTEQDYDNEMLRRVSESW